MDEAETERFRKLLDGQNAWPSEYTFKFIVPEDRLPDLEAVFGQIPFTVRESRNGRYRSVTATVLMHSADEIMALYAAASRISGLIAL